MKNTINRAWKSKLGVSTYDRNLLNARKRDERISK
jgi:hypothetical protein